MRVERQWPGSGQAVARQWPGSSQAVARQWPGSGKTGKVKEKQDMERQ